MSRLAHGDAWDSVHSLVGEELTMRSPSGKCLKGGQLERSIGRRKMALDGGVLGSVSNRQGKED
jgi:hypothetical protein